MHALNLLAGQQNDVEINLDNLNIHEIRETLRTIRGHVLIKLHTNVAVKLAIYACMHAGICLRLTKPFFIVQNVGIEEYRGSIKSTTKKLTHISED